MFESRARSKNFLLWSSPNKTNQILSKTVVPKSDLTSRVIPRLVYIHSIHYSFDARVWGRGGQRARTQSMNRNTVIIHFLSVLILSKWHPCLKNWHPRVSVSVLNEKQNFISAYSVYSATADHTTQLFVSSAVE